MEKKTQGYYLNERTEMLEFIPDSAQTILEIGCGGGGFIGQLKGRKELWGVEPNAEAFTKAKERLDKVLHSNVEDAIAQLPADKFDVIIFNDVLEHLLQPGAVLSALKEKLTGQGVIVASIPNVRFIKNLHHVLVGKDWKYASHGILDSTHYRFFTKKSIQRLFEESGYKIVKMKGVNGTKHLWFRMFSMLLSIFLITPQSDSRYMQYAVVASKK